MAKVQKSMDSSSLSEVVDRILDKGIVIDAFVKVSLVGIELLSIEARVVIASGGDVPEVRRSDRSDRHCRDACLTQTRAETQASKESGDEERPLVSDGRPRRPPCTNHPPSEIRSED